MRMRGDSFKRVIGRVVDRLRCKDCRCNSQESEAQRATPLPYVKVIVVASVLFVNQYGSMMLFPFLPFMVHDFYPDLSREELGQKAGFLGSAFFLGNFIGSFGWGWASDVFGRKPIMLLGLFFSLVTELLFGFSQSFPWAVSARFFWGLLNGNLGVAKTYISEVCDDTNQAKGFSVIGVSAGIGRIVGSVVGGFLSQPASKYSLFENQFFCQFPYSLPCLLGALICLLSFIAASVFIEETLHKSKRRGSYSSNTSTSEDVTNSSSSDSGIELARQLPEEEEGTVREEEEEGEGEEDERDVKKSISDNMLVIMESDVDSESDGGVVSLDESATSDTELLINETRRRERRRTRNLRRWSASWSPNTIVKGSQNRLRNLRTRFSTFLRNCTLGNVCQFVKEKPKLLLRKLLEVARLMVDRKVFLSTSLYGMFGGLHVMVNETFPLLMVTCYSHGGYHLDGNELGVVYMTSGGVQLLWQLLVYPRLVKKIGYRRTLQLGVTLCMICIFLIPFCNQITGPNGDGSDLICSDFGNSSSEEETGIPGSSGSGLSGYGSGEEVVNGTQFCEVEYVQSVNENSVRRLSPKVWIMLLSLMALLVMSRMNGFVSLFVLVGNSSLPETRGSVNGISQSLVAIFRFIAPLVGSLLFAWSENNGYGWPLDYHFVFTMVSLLILFMLFVTLFLPKSIEKKRLRPSPPPISTPQDNNTQP